MSSGPVQAILLSAALQAGLVASARAEEPMSAIDWLSQSVTLPAALPQPGIADEPAVTRNATPEPITVRPLGSPSPDKVGLLSANVTGLPAALWGGTPVARVTALIGAESVTMLPALRDLLYAVLLAELEPPADAGPEGTLLLARVDRLLELGALDQAMALLDLAGADTPERFRRWFDVALLLGEEDRACRTMQAEPKVEPTFPARIFCLARGGDWQAAALTLRTAQALDIVTDAEEALLERFLDPELFEGEPPLPVPARPSPLVWRMLEAVGEPIPTSSLPVAFAQADLRSNIGWKARIEAGERLARMGAVPANRLLGLYTERDAAASGGVWDRVEAMQRIEAALAGGSVSDVAARLPEVWDRMAGAELEVPFAELYGERLGGLALVGPPAALAFRVALLSPGYEAAARAHRPADGTEAFLAGLARGDLAGTTPPDALGAAIRDGFARDAAPPADLAALVAEAKLGEAILLAAGRVTEGTKGNLRGVTEGLATLRALGLEDVARRAALQLLLLERRG